ncbi:hypothetical protein E2C01_088928 [Portunus trituberculatus]|uniref:Uncharacterized protein n=1 Tax=Portunus trituberculatus TaxID=210409 RepID=A0A5B7JKX1_PORTR|nr:hypothetical protein [Portunus trituberculatus]
MHHALADLPESVGKEVVDALDMGEEVQQADAVLVWDPASLYKQNFEILVMLGDFAITVGGSVHQSSLS